MVWSIIGWTLLGLLGLLLLALLLPAVAYIDYRKGALTLKVRVLFVKLTLYPFKEGRAEKTPKTKKAGKRKKTGETEKKEEEKPVEKDTLEYKLAFFKRIITSAKEALGFLVRFVRITGFEFQAAVNTGDAADTAILYGRLQGLVGAIHAGLENTFTIRFKRMVLIPDFAGEYPDSLVFSCKVSAPPIIIVIAACKGLFSFIKHKPQKQPARPAAKPAAATGPQRSKPNGEQ